MTEPSILVKCLRLLVKLGSGFTQIFIKTPTTISIHPTTISIHQLLQLLTILYDTFVDYCLSFFMVGDWSKQIEKKRWNSKRLIHIVIGSGVGYLSYVQIPTKRTNPDLLDRCINYTFMTEQKIDFL